MGASLTTLSLRSYYRPLRFATVGVVGAVFNSGLLFFLLRITRLDPVLDGALATEAAIIFNFALNDVWTFRDRPYKRSWTGRAIRYNAIAAGGWAISVATLAGMIHLAGLAPMIANVFALAASFLINYLANKRFTFAPARFSPIPSRDVEAPDEGESSPTMSRRSTTMRHLGGTAALFAAVSICVLSLVAFSAQYQHWYAIFRQPKSVSWDVHPPDLTGAWPLLPVIGVLLAVGALAIPLLRPRPLPFVERLLWASLIAFAAAGLPMVVLSVFGILYPATVLASVFGIALALAITVLLRGDWSRIAAWWRMPSPKTPLGWSLPRLWSDLLVGYIGAVAATLLFHGATKPVYDYDAAIYHAAMAKILVNAHGMPLITGPSPGIEMSANYPPLFPAIGAFTLILANGNDLAFRIVPALAALLAVGASYCIGRRLSPSLGILAAAFVLTAQILPSYATLGTVYTLMAFILAMGFLALETYIQEGDASSIALASSCLGLLALCSYQGLVYLIWVPAAAAVIVSRGSTLKSTTIRIAALLAPVTTIGAFWYVRNWVVLGDPVYPWFYRFFGGIDLNSPVTLLAQASVTQVAHDVTFGFGQGPSPANLLHLTFLDRSLFPVLSPIAILGLIAALFLTRRRPTERLIVWLIVPCAILPIVIIVATGTLFLRYIVPVIPVLALLSAFTFYWIAKPVRRANRMSMRQRRMERGYTGALKGAATASLIFMLIFPGLLVALSGPFYHEAFDFQQNRPYLASWYWINPDPYAFNSAAYDPGFEAFQWIQSHLGSGRRVATYESRLYYLFNADYRRVLFLDGSEVDPIWNESDPSTVANYLKSRNADYVWLSRIVQVGADRLPLVQTIVGNTPQFPIVWQTADAFIYHVGPIEQLNVGESADVTMNDSAMWTNLTSLGGSAARAVIPTSQAVFEPAGVLVENNDDSGFVTFDYLDRGDASALGVDIWTGAKPQSWSRLLTPELHGTGDWRGAVVWVPGHEPYGLTRLGFRPMGDKVYIRNIRFVPEGARSPNLTLLGSWQPGWTTPGGQFVLTGVRSQDPQTVRSQFADIAVQIPVTVRPYLDVRFIDPTAPVTVVQKIGEIETPIATLLSAGTGASVSQRITLEPDTLARGLAYLIFDTHGKALSIQGLDYVTGGDAWEPTPLRFEGPWRTEVNRGLVVGLAHRGGADWSDLSIPFLPYPNVRLRLAYIDSGRSALIVSSLDAKEQWHTLQNVTTGQTGQVRYLDLTAAENYQRPDGMYVILDTRGGEVPVVGIEMAAPF